MLEILDEIFKQKEFYKMEKIVEKESVKRVYTNSFDDMYIIMETKLNGNTIDELMDICQEIFKEKTVNKAKKSNWFLLLLVKQDEYLSYEQNHISDMQRKWILDIEENQFYCRKYVLWYAEEEKEALREILNENYEMDNIYNVLQNYEYFREFKESKNVGYELLTRLCIKLPFMNLLDLKQMNKSIEEILASKVNAIEEGLFDLLVEYEDINLLLESVPLDVTEYTKIENDILELVGDENE